MSRGPGYVQRLILEQLDERIVADDPWADIGAIAERLGHSRRSVRRALRLLAADGLVEVESVRARIAVARLDEAAIRRARRTQARALRRDLGVSLRCWFNLPPGPADH